LRHSVLSAWQPAEILATSVILSPSTGSGQAPRRSRHCVILSNAKDLEILRRLQLLRMTYSVTFAAGC